MDLWQPISSISGVAAVLLGIPVIVSQRSKAKADHKRQRSELRPEFMITCERMNPGAPHLRLRVKLIGPQELDHLDAVRISIRNDSHLRGAPSSVAGGPPTKEIMDWIWGPYRFRPGTGPTNKAPADRDGRAVTYAGLLPIGEQLTFLLEPTPPPPWAHGMSMQTWEQDQGPIIRLEIEAENATIGSWRVLEEISIERITS